MMRWLRESCREHNWAALANFKTFGDRAADNIKETERLIEVIAKKASGA
jgi:hypothetical protein